VGLGKGGKGGCELRCGDEEGRVCEPVWGDGCIKLGVWVDDIVGVVTFCAMIEDVRWV
jgi:hypothetical protein